MSFILYPPFKPAPQGGSAPKTLQGAAPLEWVRQIVDVVNRILSGKLNVMLQVTLNANAATTVVKDARIGPYSGLFLQPLTANAQADYISATGVLVQPNSQINGQVTLAHPNNANADKTFNLLIIG